MRFISNRLIFLSHTDTEQLMRTSHLKLRYLPAHR